MFKSDNPIRAKRLNSAQVEEFQAMMRARGKNTDDYRQLVERLKNTAVDPPEPAPETVETKPETEFKLNPITELKLNPMPIWSNSGRKPEIDIASDFPLPPWRERVETPPYEPMAEPEEEDEHHPPSLDDLLKAEPGIVESLVEASEPVPVQVVKETVATPVPVQPIQTKPVWTNRYRPETSTPATKGTDIGRLCALGSGVVISLLAGYISVLGIGALFPGGGLLVKAMGAAMEVGKVVLVANLSNASRLGRVVLLMMTFLLMSITGLGVYGFLSAAHQSDKGGTIVAAVQVDTLGSQMALAKQTQADAEAVIKRLDAAEDGYAALKMVSKAASVHRQQAVARAEAEATIARAIADQQRLLAQTATATVTTHTDDLSPIHYAAQALGWEEDQVVRTVILILMLAFDPLGLMLVAVASWKKSNSKI